MFWIGCKDGDQAAYAFFRRHYSARATKPKIRQFVGPGEKLVLVGFMCNALFVWRKFIDDSGQTGVNCAVFRNESWHRSSDMIREADEVAFGKWPGERHYTTVNPKKIRSTNPGYCFLMAGWKRCGVTKSGLVILSKFLPVPELGAD